MTVPDGLLETVMQGRPVRLYGVEYIPRPGARWPRMRVWLARKIAGKQSP